MTEENKSKIEIILEFLKVLLSWPTVVIFFLFYFQDSVIHILKNRNLEVGGIFKITGKIDSLDESIKTQLIKQRDELNLIKKFATNPDKVIHYSNVLISSLDGFEKGVEEEIKAIQTNIQKSENVTPDNSINAGSEPKTVIDWELLGFEFILNKDVNNAIYAFTEAEKISPAYHNVVEIKSLLKKDKHSLENSKSSEWKTIYQKILSKYSWGMPMETLKEMKKEVQ